MTPSPSQINRIHQLLQKSGIRDQDYLEEMLDHYLSDVEYGIANGLSEAEAIELSCNKLDQADLKQFKRNRRWQLLFIFLALITIGILLSAISNDHFNYRDIEKSSIDQEGPEGWPLEERSASITSNFGMRKNPITHKHQHHNGMDIRAKEGTPVISTGNAIVQEVGYNNRSGNYIILRHNYRYSTKFCHLSNVCVQAKELIEKGSVIGMVGKTGRCTSPHLHYEIIDEDEPIDPLECIRA